MTLAITAEPVPLRTDPDGVVCVGKTRVTLETVLGSFLDGATAEEIASQYPSLELADVYAVIAYYLRRKQDVDAYLQRQQEIANKIRSQNELRFDPTAVRARLLARRRTA
jgi:uncharacterized protein (DUF433 family)